MLSVYADETGTGGIPASGKEPAPGVYGVIATPEYWEIFCRDWSDELKKHKAKYFHFCELSPAGRRDKESGFFGWEDERADNFIYDMAIIATTKAIPFGGSASEKKLGKSRAYQEAFKEFFSDFRDLMKDFYPRYKEKVSFFFSDFENEPWLAALNKARKDAIHRDSRIGELAFIDPESHNGLPCQAADLFAYKNRQTMERSYDAGHYNSMTLLDFMFSRTGSRGNHPLSKLRTLSVPEWRDMVNKLRSERRLFETKNNIPGKSKTNLFAPLKHSPMVKDFLADEMRKYTKSAEWLNYWKRST